MRRLIMMIITSVLSMVLAFTTLSLPPQSSRGDAVVEVVSFHRGHVSMLGSHHTMRQQRQDSGDIERHRTMAHITLKPPGRPIAACETSNATVNTVPVGSVMSSANRSEEARCRQLHSVEDYRGFRECFGMLEDRTQFRTSEWENRLHRDQDPIMMPMHGGVSPQRMAQLSVQLSRLCPTPPVESPELWTNDTVIVEFGCGNAGLLSIVAPRSPHVFGVGTEVAESLVEHGSAFFPHLAVHRAIGAPMVPAGAATCAYSLAVVMYLTISATCNHIAEGLRVLEAGDKMILHGIPLVFPRIGAWSTFRQSFFVRKQEFLPSCTGGIGGLVKSVRFPVDPSFAVYPGPNQFMTVVIERNDVEFPCAVAEITGIRETNSKLAFLKSQRRRQGRSNAGNDTLSWSSRRLRCLLDGFSATC